MHTLTHTHTHQLDDLNKHPVIGGAGHKLEEGGCERKVVPWILPSQLTNHRDSCRLNTYIQESNTLSTIILSKVTAPQDAHKRLVLQVYLGSNTLEFSAIRRFIKCVASRKQQNHFGSRCEG